jgi:hypothetical protein
MIFIPFFFFPYFPYFREIVKYDAALLGYMEITTITTTKATTDGLPEGVNAPEAVRYLAGMRGLRYKDDKLPEKLIFGEAAGFSEPVAFVRTSKGDGFYLVRHDQCSCPSYRFRGGVCKHMKAVRSDLERKARVDARNAERREERARSPRPSASRGFNQPDEVTA